jgi:hypothetical protein
MKSKKLLALIAILACCILVFAACEPVSGVNLNNIMKSSLNQESYEGRSRITIEPLPGDYSESLGELAAMLAFVQSIELDFYEVKQQDLNTASVKGNLNIVSQSIPIPMSIPLAMSITSDKIVIQVEGIERPLVYELISDYSELGLDIDMTLLASADVDVARLLLDYLVPNLPNPNKINYSNTTIELNGEQKNVGKIHAELDGAELVDLIQITLRNLAQDEEGLRDFLSGLYDVLLPIIENVIDQSDSEDNVAIGFVRAYLNNKTLVTEFLYTTITQGYQTALKEFSGIEQELADDEVLSGISATADIYLDSSLNIVRTDYELVISNSPEEGGVVIRVTNEQWNINGDIEADLLDDTNGINLESNYLEQQILSSIDPNSLIGQLLSASGYNQTTSYIWIDDPSVYVDNGTSFISAYEISYYLDVELDWWSLYSDQIILYDYTGTTIELPLGQNKIIVDGVEYEVPRGAFEAEYDYYVPIRAVAEALGYEVIWDAEFQTIDLIKTYF